MSSPDRLSRAPRRTEFRPVAHVNDVRTRFEHDATKRPVSPNDWHRVTVNSRFPSGVIHLTQSY
jgi:hypothetical protein